ncbi:UNVERIFIED_CONTAM: hypothetical protein K2H54_037619, partial [Gekko kuhli]
MWGERLSTEEEVKRMRRWRPFGMGMRVRMQLPRAEKVKGDAHGSQRETRHMRLELEKGALMCIRAQPKPCDNREKRRRRSRK